MKKKEKNIQNIVTIKDNPKKYPKDHYRNLPDEKQYEIQDLSEIFYDKKTLKLCLQSIGTYDWGYGEDEPGDHYLLEDIIELAIETFQEELEYGMAQIKHFKNLIKLQKEMDKIKGEFHKK